MAIEHIKSIINRITTQENSTMNTLTFVQINKLRKKALVDYAISIGVKSEIKDPNIKFETLNDMTITELLPKIKTHQASMVHSEHHRTTQEHLNDFAVIGDGVHRVEDLNAEADETPPQSKTPDTEFIGGYANMAQPHLKNLYADHWIASFGIYDCKSNRTDLDGYLLKKLRNVWVQIAIPDHVDPDYWVDTVYRRQWKDDKKKAVAITCNVEAKPYTTKAGEEIIFYNIVGEVNIPENGGAGLPTVDEDKICWMGYSKKKK